VGDVSPVRSTRPDKSAWITSVIYESVGKWGGEQNSRSTNEPREKGGKRKSVLELLRLVDTNLPKQWEGIAKKTIVKCRRGSGYEGPQFIGAG